MNPAASTKLRATPAQPIRERGAEAAARLAGAAASDGARHHEAEHRHEAGTQDRRLGRARDEARRQAKLDRDQRPEADRPREGALEAEAGERLTPCLTG